MGVNPGRLRLEWISASEGIRFAEVMNDFSRKVKEIGPLGRGEGESGNGFKSKLEAINNLIPYIKLVERERLRAPSKSEEEHHRFFSSDEAKRLFDELIGEKLAKLSLEKDIKQIVFDRGRYLYHGRIKALADGARSGGLQF